VTTRHATLALLAAPIFAVLVVATFLPAPRSDAPYCAAAGAGRWSLDTLRNPDATNEQIGYALSTVVAETPDTIAQAPSEVRDDWEVVLRWARAYTGGDPASRDTPSVDAVVAAADTIEEDYGDRCLDPFEQDGGSGGLDDG